MKTLKVLLMAFAMLFACGAVYGECMGPFQPERPDEQGPPVWAGTCSETEEFLGADLESGGQGNGQNQNHNQNQCDPGCLHQQHQYGNGYARP